MKRTLLIFIFLLSLITAKVNAQSVFQKVYYQILGNIEQEVLPNEDIVTVGFNTIDNNKGVVVVRFNKCGNLIWSMRYSQNSIDIDVIDLKLDTNQNILIAGNIITNGIGNAYLMSLTPNGAINYFKVFDSGTDDVAYSMDLNSQNEVLFYFKTNIGQAGPNSERTLAKLNASGQVIWIKEYGFSPFRGRICSSSDGGALISENIDIIKIDNLGNVSWNKKFESSNYEVQDHFEIPGGYVFLRSRTSALNRAYASMIDYSGDVKWNSQLIPDFYPYKGVLRKNGNLLFVGGLYYPNVTGGGRALTFIEIDSSQGFIDQTVIQHNYSPPFIPSDINELKDSSIIYSGREILSFAGSNFISRVNDTLSRVACKDTSIILNYPRETGLTQTSTSWIGQSVAIPITEPFDIDIDTLDVSSFHYWCIYNSNSIKLDLGKDTTLCPGDSMTLAASANFDGYEWSTSQSSASIKIGEAGTYWLNAWVDCDTISDTIQITYHTLPKLELGNDTTLCLGEQVTFSTNNGETAYWSTGDTTTNITVDQAGKYWGNIPTVCGFISDTIELMHHPELQEPKFGDTSICINTHLQLNVDPNASYVLWSTGESTHQIQTNIAGVYDVTIANACDTLRDTFQLSFHPKPNFIPSISKDTAKFLDSVFFQLLSPNNFQSLQWDFGDGGRSTQPNSSHQYKQSGWMHPRITLVDSLGCTSDSSLRIYIQALKFHIPNVFTPNRDGVNDVFEVYGKGIEKMQIKIFNLWGDLIYESNNAAWDGKTLGGKAASEGTYLYVIRFTQSGNAEETVKGTVNLMRSKKGSSSEQQDY